MKAPLIPLIHVFENRPRSAPAAPTAGQLIKHFESAWSLVPPKRLPDLTLPEGWPAPKGYAGTLPVRVEVRFMNDKQIAKPNWEFMQHEGATDVLSFPMGEYNPEFEAFDLGQIFLSYETAAREARARKLPEAEEIARYAVHGFLHLLGYDDQTPKQFKEMHALQEKALKNIRSR
jgi:probable rRNA maturation factor